MPRPARARDDAAPAGAEDTTASPPAAKRARKAPPKLHEAPPTGARRHAEGTPATDVGNALPMTKHAPKDYCTILRHPVSFDEDRWVRDLERRRPMGEIEFILDADWMVPQPEGFYSFHGKEHDITVQAMRILNLIGYLSNRVIDPKDKPKKKGRAGGDDEDEGALPPVQRNSIEVFWERVPHREDPGKFVAIRVRVIEWSESDDYRFDLLDELIALIYKNELAASKRMAPTGKGGAGNPRFQPTKVIDSYSNITPSEYERLCQFANPHILLTHEARERVGLSFTDRRSPYHLTNVFSIERNCRIVRNLEGHPDYCDERVYCQRVPLDSGGTRPTYRFGQNGANCWQISPRNLVPENLANTKLPCAYRDPRAFPEARARYSKMHGIVHPVDQTRIFDITCHHTATSQPANDMDAFTKRVAREDAELRRIHFQVGRPENLARSYFAARHERVIKDWLPAISHIISPTGDCPPAVQHIKNWQQTYIAENKGNMTMLKDTCFENLTRFGNMQASYLVMMKSVLTVVSSHQDCLLYLYCAHHVYSRVEMNPHHLILGPPGIGKSFALMVMLSLLIEGSYESVGRISAQALTAPGKINACKIFVFEDAQSSMFGVSGGSGGGKGKAGASATSDIENIIKKFLTSTHLDVKTTEYKDGNREGQYYRCDTSSILFAAMNDDSSLFPKPILDRAIVTINAETPSSEQTGSSSNTMLGMAQRASMEAVKQAAAVYADQWYRVQSLVCDIFHAESATVLKSIDLSATDLLYDIVCRVAAKRNIDMTRRRPLERFRMVVRTCVVHSAIDLNWDTPNAPMTDQYHRPEHYMNTDKHLKASLEHGIFVFGMVARMWQDSARTIIVQAMLRAWFQDHETEIEAYKRLIKRPLPMETDEAAERRRRGPPQPPAGITAGQTLRADQQTKPGVFEWQQAVEEYNAFQREEMFWMYSTCYFGKQTLPIMPVNGRNVPSTHDIIVYLADKIHPHLEKKYLKTEVIGQLHAMTRTNMEIHRQQQIADDDYRDETLERPQLVVEQGCIRLALPLIEHLHQQGVDVFFESVQEAASALYITTQKKQNGFDVLYGECESKQGSRHVFRTLPLLTREQLLARGIVPEELARVENADHEEKSVQLVVQNQLGSFNPDYYSRGAMCRLYTTDQPFAVITQDPDEMVALKRAMELGLSEEEQHEYPSNDPNMAWKQMQHHARTLWPDRERMWYPECFETRDYKTWNAYWKKEYEADPEKFTTSYRYQQMLQQRKVAFPSRKERQREQEAERRGIEPAAILMEEDADEEEQKNDPGGIAHLFDQEDDDAAAYEEADEEEARQRAQEMEMEDVQ